GKLSSHKQFGEANALLAGDALLTHAFSLIAQAALDGRVSAQASVQAAAELSRLCGAAGMIGGQYIDLAYENKAATADVLFQQDALKTAALIEAACVMGLIAADASAEQIEAARRFALGLGLAFQITDDILEEREGGVSSDAVNGKATYVSEMGLEKARETAAAYTEDAINALDLFGDNACGIKAFALALLRRTK
ncbi:MAG: polyprenyl synthetase family protein, partial [Clostridia bacterium]|nr:polyprenyl synthetase family protein [Clostridia bacterium]